MLKSVNYRLQKYQWDDAEGELTDCKGLLELCEDMGKAISERDKLIKRLDPKKIKLNNDKKLMKVKDFGERIVETSPPLRVGDVDD